MKRFMNKKVAAIGLAAGLALGACWCGLRVLHATGSGSGTGSTGWHGMDRTPSRPAVQPCTRTWVPRTCDHCYQQTATVRRSLKSVNGDSSAGSRPLGRLAYGDWYDVKLDSWTLDSGDVRRRPDCLAGSTCSAAAVGRTSRSRLTRLV